MLSYQEYNLNDNFLLDREGFQGESILIIILGFQPGQMLENSVSTEISAIAFRLIGNGGAFRRHV